MCADVCDNYLFAYKSWAGHSLVIIQKIFLRKAGILVLVNLKTGIYHLSSIKTLVWVLPTIFLISNWTNPLSQIKKCRHQWLSWMCPQTGDQKVAGSTPAEVGHILLWRLIMKYFLFLSLLLIQEGQLSVSGKTMCTILVNCLKD